MRAISTVKIVIAMFLLGGIGGCAADPTPPQPTSPPIRALLITGGHEHDIGFYSIFESYKDAVQITVSSSNIAFAKDFRDKYDVLPVEHVASESAVS